MSSWPLPATTSTSFDFKFSIALDIANSLSEISNNFSDKIFFPNLLIVFLDVKIEDVGFTAKDAIIS